MTVLVRRCALVNRAGGPSRVGSFRDVKVRRGNDLGAMFDLYLQHGDASRDVHLENDDIVFGPTVGTQVTVDARVRRAAIYEIRPDETLTDVLY